MSTCIDFALAQSYTTTMINKETLSRAQARYRQASQELARLEDLGGENTNIFLAAEKEWLAAMRTLDAMTSQTERWNDKSNSLLDLLERGDV